MKHFYGKRKRHTGRRPGAVCLAAVLAIQCAAAGCAVTADPSFPPVTVSALPTPSATADSHVIVTDQPQVTSQSEAPISFTDINFENAVRETLGRSIGGIYPSDLENITVFSARVSGIINIKEISYFKSLEELDLMGNRINDLSPVSSLKNLKKLNVSKNFTVMTGDREKGLDISPLGALPRLEWLDASNDLITDISALGSLSSLKWLDIQNNRLSDVTGLSGCVSLEYLNISDSYRIDPDKSEGGIRDLAGLENLVKLKTLHMRNGLVQSLEPLSGLSELEYVDASYNLMRAVPDLSGMSSLGTLILKFNSIISLEGLAGQSTVTILDVRNNFIRTCDEILEMPALETVYLDGNPIIDTRPIDVFEAIKNGTYVPTPAPENTDFPDGTGGTEGAEAAENGGSAPATPEAPAGAPSGAPADKMPGGESPVNK